MTRQEKLQAIKSRILRFFMADAIESHEEFSRLADDYKEAISSLNVEKSLTFKRKALGYVPSSMVFCVIWDNVEKDEVDFSSHPKVKRVVATFEKKRDALVKRYPDLVNRNFLQRLESKKLPVAEALSFVDPKDELSIDEAYRRVETYIKKIWNQK